MASAPCSAVTCWQRRPDVPPKEYQTYMAVARRAGTTAKSNEVTNRAKRSKKPNMAEFFCANDANTWKWPNIRPSLAFSLARLRKKHQQVTKGERGGPGRTEENRGGPRRTEEVPRSSEEVPRKFRGSSEEVPRKNRGGPRRGSRGPKRLREAST